ncbi:MAG: helix-turn-helix transcriptional regulator, partial [Sinomicrobium sp.]|nr:helix-turn-helix transcriptional regulator [Sinomicrobium sp.]
AQHILERLSDFVKKQQYLDQEVNLHTLAKKLQTNPKYLSKTINYYEQKSFTSYINDLRINYAVSRLKTDRKLQRYAVKAIADETGFSNQQSFSQAFHKKTGMHPSYFIKQLQKHSYN